MYTFTFNTIELHSVIPSFSHSVIQSFSHSVNQSISQSVIKTNHITVTGLVQGVGFRPCVYRIATRLGLGGWVLNTSEDVQICLSGETEKLQHFVKLLRAEAPAASRIENIEVREYEYEVFAEFSIRSSHDIAGEITEISPDIAVCSECLADIEIPGSRLDYSFVNCTNCGPRFTIISDLPYDRARTTMQSFPMCSDCRKEYEDILDRRFHAQPTACERCGPRYELFINGDKNTSDIGIIISKISECLADGGVALIRGLGGMHLACDAFNTAAVSRLRGIKKRDGKPFAVMFCDIEAVKQYTEMSLEEEESLLSWRRPIVLLKLKPINYQGDASTGSSPMQVPESQRQPSLSHDINSGLDLLGVMLPYMPLHYLLFRHLKTKAIVLTSGNFSSEPILIDNDEALRQFSSSADAILLHNRDIYNRTDDSVVRIIGEKERVIRRSRGYVPSPVYTGLNTEGILAFGAELTNTFCMGRGRKAFLSQHIGDLQGLETSLFYEQTMARFLKLFRVKPSLLAVDMHPEYISTRAAQQFGDLPLVRVQHHHAHIASCMAEHRLDEKVIGIALDGTGYGDDGHTWGSEFMVCDLAGYTRITHFEYLPMPGGDMASEEPWRMAVSWLFKVFGKDLISLELPLFREIDPEKIELLLQMIIKKVNCPLTSGAGRLFDAVASLLGICQIATFQAEGPMRLEAMVQKDCTESYSYELSDVICFDSTLRAMVADITMGTDPKIIATKFHNTIISVIFETANAIRRKENINKVVLSGGVFQNKYLSEGALCLLKENDFEVYAHAAIPTNDGGIALGQLAVASKRRELRCV